MRVKVVEVSEWWSARLVLSLSPIGPLSRPTETTLVNEKWKSACP